MKEKPLNEEYSIVRQRSNIFKTPKAIVSTDQDLKICPCCTLMLEKYHALISMGNGMSADIPGVWCRKCDKLFVKNGKVVYRLLKDNKLAKGYTLNGEELWDYTNEKQRLKCEEKRRKNEIIIRKARIEKLLGAPSSEVMICVCFADKSYMD